jgi:hypothetical protein
VASTLTCWGLILHAPSKDRASLVLVATLPFGSVFAAAPAAKSAKVTLVYQHELPNVPGKSIKGVLVEYGPGGYSPCHFHPKSGQRRTGNDLQGRAELFRAARRAPRRQR